MRDNFSSKHIEILTDPNLTKYKLIYFKTPDSPNKLYLIMLTLAILLCSSEISCQTTTTTSITSESLEYDGILGIGWGVFAIILAIIIGIICCIFGLSTVYPAIFIAIGFLVPLIIFLIMAFSPLDQPGNLNLKDNTATNSYIVVKWIYFSCMLIGLFLLLIPFLGIWRAMLIPQRVDSRAQREYFQKYEKFMEEEKRLKNEKNGVKNDYNNLISNTIGNVQIRDTRLNVNNIGRISNNNNSGINTDIPIREQNVALNYEGGRNIMNHQNEYNSNADNIVNDKRKKFLGGLLRRKRNEDN